MNDLLHLLMTDTQIYALDSYGSDENSPMFWLLGPIGAVSFYSWVYLRYRNTDKRHEYEKKTATELGEISGFDQMVDKVKGVSNSTIPGNNVSSPRTRLGQGSTFIETWQKKE